jgi:peptide/nickel transport system substrate-binding protein
MKKILFSLIIVTLVFGLVLGGCTKTEKATTGGIFKFSDPMPVYSQFGDPLNIFGPSNYPASISLERLIEPGDKFGTYKNILAEDIVLAKDKTYYDIKLRKNVKFHDGTDFDATAVKWNMDRVKEAQRAELAKVSSVSVVDKYTVRLNLTAWDSRMLNDLFRDDLFMISPTAFEANGGAEWANTHPIGTGPFIFKEIKDNQYLVWVKNPNYWQKGLPKLDGVELHSIGDPVTFTAALKAGEILGTWVSNRQTGSELQKDPNYKVYICYPWFTQGLSMNTIEPTSAWSDLRMRQALAYALDEETICNTLGRGFIDPRYAIITGIESTGYKNANPYKYNLDKAKQLMADAGYSIGFSFKLYISTGQWTGGDGDYVLAWQQQLEKLGLKMEIMPTEQAVISEMTQKPMTGNDMVTTFLRGNGVSLLEPIMESLQEGTLFDIGYARPAEWKDLIALALVEEDSTKQLELIKQMEKVAYEQLLPYIPLQSSGLISIMSAKAHDYTFSLGGAYLANAWLEE